jgi:hypothetical protein
MYESSYFCEFLDECGKSEHFDKFLKESKRSGVDIAGHIKENFLSKNTKNKK